MATLTELLTAADSQWVRKDWARPQNDCIDDIIERFDDCPEGLQDFDRSDWVNLCECYTYQLLDRWNKQEESVMALFNDYCDAIGATSTIHALEGEADGFGDGDDMNAAIVNHAMTWAAHQLADEIYPDR
jgi:hypothetical protein